jgi:hypothetical protein
MSQRISSKPSILPVGRTSFPRINSFFDAAELVVERSDRLLSKSKPVVVNLFLFLHLIIDLIIVLVVLWKFG